MKNENSMSIEEAAKLFAATIDDKYFDVCGDWGIRFDDRLLHVGEVFPYSHELRQDQEWDDEGEEIFTEGEGYYKGLYDLGELNGTCAYYIDTQLPLSSDKIEQIERTIVKHLTLPWFRDYVYLVSGYDKGWGTEEDEVLLDNARVVSVLTYVKGERDRLAIPLD